MKQSIFWCDKCKEEIEMPSLTGGYYDESYQGSQKHLCGGCKKKLKELIASFWEEEES